MYAITLHQPWASLIALGLKTVETRSWPAPARLVGQTVAVHAGKRVVRGPSVLVERELQARWGEECG
ncbi:MAG: ASCH domain-containing protein [Chloroflexi bacterium]|nr:ASCH domain-containing protein [Chloroflexota bacterium]